ncbi:zinc metallopeptidase [Aureliella helgolandensis]|uniref:Neutral zinc metallopeptidase n=1 Tax=Aureliella helgolandensis TaxID=2527968 RepID=A0A518FZU1_9BACT|nr:zinc metallopeptidase [Aureliella helgolandensis]QDV21851.1 Putative neutral zinc metallopeptidase [Aureliella helgolandensis]
MLLYLLFFAPVLLLALAAQWMVKSAYARMSQVPASMSGFQAARRILDNSGLHNVAIEQVPGELSDHYDPRAKVLRLSPGVYSGSSMASVGIAAHEVGHALQDARHYAPLVLRNLAVPAASIGSGLGSIVLSLGLFLLFTSLAPLGKLMFLAGLVGLAAVAVFQLINLPVEFDASSRAKVELVNLGIVSHSEIHNVSKVLNAAALTYVAATLQSIMTLAYYIFYYMSASRRD